MYCPKCGTKNDPAAKFCKNCGQPLAAAKPASDQPKQSGIRTQATAENAVTRTQSQPRNWLWFVGGLVLALIVGGIWLTVAL